MVKGDETNGRSRRSKDRRRSRPEEVLVKQLPLTLCRTSTLTLEKSLLNNIKSLLYIGFYITSYS